MECLEVQLLGGFRVFRDGRVVPQEAWQHRRGAELVKVLALAREHRLHRDQVIEALWPQLSYQAGLANLHKAAHFARRAIGESEGVVVHGGQVVLAPAAVVKTDIERFEAEAEAYLDHAPACIFCPTGLYIAATIGYAKAGGLARARSFLERAEGTRPLWAGGPRAAALAEARAAVLAAEGSRDEAAAALADAVAGFARAGQLVNETRAHAALSRLL